MRIKPALLIVLGAGLLLIAAIMAGQMLPGSGKAQAAATPNARPTSTLTPGPREDTHPTLSAPTPTLTPTLAYALPAIDYQRGLGLSHLYIMDTEWPVPQTADRRADLHIPAPQIVASRGRFLDIRGNASQLLHLGSDYLNPANTPLVPPSDNSLLAAALYLEIGQYEAIALDMAGNIQMYLVTAAMPQGIRQYLICYAHLERGSNQAAIQQALANGGHVKTAGTISAISAENPLLSDLHIAVIDVDRLLARTGRSTLHDALMMLFSGQLPRTNQQFADIFVRPEDVITALQPLIENKR